MWRRRRRHKLPKLVDPEPTTTTTSTEAPTTTSTTEAPTPMSITGSIPDPVTENEETNISIGTIANDDEGKMVRAFFTLPESFLVTYQEGGVGPDITLVDVFGPSTGFPLGDITTPFKLTADEIGTFTIIVEFRQVSDNTVLASEEFSVEVVAEI